MLVSYCRECKYHEISDVEGDEHSKCNKENCLSVYTKCLTEEAVKQFLQRDKLDLGRVAESALEICYEKL
jgi:hypothetical protein